jgi:hypothetical protein
MIKVLAHVGGSGDAPNAHQRDKTEYCRCNYSQHINFLSKQHLLRCVPREDVCSCDLILR